MIRPLTLLCLLGACGAGLYLYQIKHQVALLDRELRDTRRATEAARDRTQVLRAEWALLNEPDRLRQVAQRHLPLEPMTPAQFIRTSELDRRLPTAIAFVPPTSIFAAREAGPPARQPAPDQAAPARAPAPQVAAATPPAAPSRPATVTLPAATPARPQAAPATPAAAPAAAQPLPRPVQAPPPSPAPQPMIAAAPRPPAAPPAPAALAAAPPPRPPAAPAPRPAAPAATPLAEPPRIVAAAQATPPRPPAAAPRPTPTPPPLLRQTVHAPPPATPAEAVARIARGEPVDRNNPAVASALGAARPALAPPVPIGTAEAATLPRPGPTIR